MEDIEETGAAIGVEAVITDLCSCRTVFWVGAWNGVFGGGLSRGAAAALVFSPSTVT